MADMVFIDPHCHMFNIVDIPLVSTLQGKIRMGTLERLVTAIAAGAGLVLGLGERLLEHYEDFVRFFERDLETNLRWFALELRQAVTQNGIDAELIVITPLIMDFDLVQATTRIGGDASLQLQLARLEAAIAAANEVLAVPEADLPIKVLPFMGYDLRKLEDDPDAALDRLQDLWTAKGVTPAERQAGLDGIDSGRLLGIKLYPPLGFSPCPSKRAAAAAYRAFFEWCVDPARDIPITTHCQPTSFTAARSRSETRDLADPLGWLRLLESNPQLADLRINFAHFGGEKEICETVAWIRKGQLTKQTWVSHLIRLLKEYPNTYADLSALDHSSSTARKQLGRLLSLDHHGKLVPPGPPLADKLMWGSDVPMTISHEAYRHASSGITGYSFLLGRFLKTIRSIPEVDEQVRQQTVEALTSTNPLRFLTAG